MSRHKFTMLAGILVLLCAALAWLYPLEAGLLKPRLPWAMQAGANPVVGAAHLGLYVALFAVYGVALKSVEVLKAISGNDRASRTLWVIICTGWLLASLALLFSSPGESNDVFDYLFRGRMLAEYGRSPLNTTPAELKNFPFHRYVSWSQWVDAYGPVWEYASATIAWVVRALGTPADLGVTINQTCDVQPALCVLLGRYVLAYRLFVLALTALCAWLIAWLAPPKGRLVAVLAWLWNPLTLISTAAGAHNEPLLIAFVLLAALCFTRQRWVWGMLALVLAAHVKITALVLLPVFGLWLVQRAGWSRAVRCLLMLAVIGLVISWLLYWPLGGWATLTRNIAERGQLSTNSWGELLFLWLRNGWGWTKPDAQRVVAQVAPLVFVGVAGLLLLGWLRRPSTPNGGDTDNDLANTTHLNRLGLIVALYLVLGSYWFQAWYVLWPLALVCVVPQRYPARTSMILFGATALLSATLADYLRASTLGGSAGWQGGAISVLVVCLTMLPTSLLVIRWAATTVLPAGSRDPRPV